MDRLGDEKELVGAANDPPLDVEPDVGHQRHECVVDLRDAAAESRRRDVHDPLPLQRLREPRDLVHQPARHEGGVVGERLVADVDELQHPRDA